jgi:hypothetical protein
MLPDQRCLHLIHVFLLGRSVLTVIESLFDYAWCDPSVARDCEWLGLVRGGQVDWSDVVLCAGGWYILFNPP